MTRAQLERWLIGREHSHVLKCHWATTSEGFNDDLNDPIWDALRRIGRPIPADPAAVTSAEVEAVPTSKLNGLLIASRFYLLERVLAHYQSRADQAIGINNRMDFAEQAKNLAEYLYGKDRKGGLKAEMEDEVSTFGIGGAVVGERLTYTNIPNADCIPRRY